MNAGCYGSEFKDIVLDVNFLNRNGKKIKKKAKEIDFKYRESNIPKDLIITSVNLMGFKKNKEEIKRKICEISKKRIYTAKATLVPLHDSYDAQGLKDV